MKCIAYITALFSCNLFCASCQQAWSKKENNYSNDTLISDSQGNPKNSSTLYLPYTIKCKDSLVHTNLDTLINEWYSFSLYKLKEPVLSNFYSGRNMYRFLWLRSFHLPVVITLCNDNNAVTLTTKELDGQVNFFELKHCMNCNTTNLKEPKLKLNETKPLTMAEWKSFETLLTKSDFWNLTPFKREMGLDGSEWNIEAHLQDRYWFVDRWSPTGKFADCGKYLIKLSGLKEDVY